MPREMVGEQPAEQRPDDGGDPEDRSQRTLVLASFAQRNDVGDQRRRGDHEPTGADALHRAPRDEPRHGARGGTHEGRDDEDRRADLEDELAAEQVTELAGEHDRDGVGDQVGGDDPGDVASAAEVADDGRQRRGHDRLVERGQQHAEHDRAEDQVDLASGQGGWVGSLHGRGLSHAPSPHARLPNGLRRGSASRTSFPTASARRPRVRVTGRPMTPARGTRDEMEVLITVFDSSQVAGFGPWVSELRDPAGRPP